MAAGGAQISTFLTKQIPKDLTDTSLPKHSSLAFTNNYGEYHADGDQTLQLLSVGIDVPQSQQQSRQ